MQFHRNQAYKNVCRQLIDSGFLADLEEYIQFVYFEQFKAVENENELLDLKMKSDIVSDVLNIIRDNAS